MRLATRSVLIISAVVLIAYPLWGVLYPDSYSDELTQHHEHALEFTLAQIKQASAWLWISNGVLALSFLLFASFLARPGRARLGIGGGIALMVYPFARIFTEVMMATSMNAPGASIEISAEKILFIVFGLLKICLVQQIAQPMRATR